MDKVNQSGKTNPKALLIERGYRGLKSISLFKEQVKKHERLLNSPPLRTKLQTDLIQTLT